MSVFINIALVNIVIYIGIGIFIALRIKLTVSKLEEEDEYIKEFLNECNGRALQLVMRMKKVRLENYRDLKIYKFSLISVILAAWLLAIAVTIAAN